MGGGTVPTPDDYLVELIKNQYIAPTHPGQDIGYVAVSTRMEAWPITGFARLMGFLLGPQEVWGPGGAGWPDEPWWKLSGLFDLTLDQAVRAGVVNLETAMAASGNDHLVIYGISEGSIIANVEKRRLAELYPVGTKAPDIDFVMQGTFNLPNGGFFARFPGLYLPIIDWSFNGPAPTDTQFDTVMINRQYEFPSDVPLYPGNVIADLNMLLGAFYVHTYAWDDSLAPDPSKSPAYQGTHGDTDYYFFETQDLPLFGPLRTLGVPESLIDIVEPFFRVIVELGYDRSIPPWQPTPARLIPPLNPVTVVGDLATAIGEGITNALTLVGVPTPAATASESARADFSGQSASMHRTVESLELVADDIVDTDALAAKHDIVDTDALAAKHDIVESDGLAAKHDIVDSDGSPSNHTASVSTSEQTKKPDAAVADRPLVRGPLGAFGQKLRDRLHRGNGDVQTSKTPAAGVVANTTGYSSPSSRSENSPSEKAPSDDSPGDGSAAGDADKS